MFKKEVFMGSKRLKGAQGFTLVEILLALIVLIIGVTGVLILYPEAIRASSESTEDSHAVTLSNSVCEALVAATRSIYYNPEEDRYYFIFVHDLGGDPVSGEEITGVVYQAPLPKIYRDDRPEEGWWSYPKATLRDDPKPSDNPEDDPAFGICADPWLKRSWQAVIDTNDPTDPYKWYAFSFDIRRVNIYSDMKMGNINLEDYFRDYWYIPHMDTNRDGTLDADDIESLPGHSYHLMKVEENPTDVMCEECEKWEIDYQHAYEAIECPDTGNEFEPFYWHRLNCPSGGLQQGGSLDSVEKWWGFHRNKMPLEPPVTGSELEKGSAHINPVFEYRVHVFRVQPGGMQLVASKTYATGMAGRMYMGE
jgi:hypothetical protein